MEQLPASRRFQLAPQPVTFLEQRHVVGVLEIRLADDAGLAVAAAAIVRRVKAVDADGPHAPPGQFVECRAAHAAGPEHDYVVCLHGRNRCRMSVVQLSVDSRGLQPCN